MDFFLKHLISCMLGMLVVIVVVKFIFNRIVFQRKKKKLIRDKAVFMVIQLFFLPAKITISIYNGKQIFLQRNFDSTDLVLWEGRMVNSLELLQVWKNAYDIPASNILHYHPL